MAVTGWGKPSIFVKRLDKAAEGEYPWKKIDTPKENTTQLNPTKGDVLEAKEEGGATIDKKTKKSTYDLVYQLYVKKNKKQPFTSIDGLIEGEYAVAVQPEDSKGTGIYIGKSTIGTEEGFTSADGGLITYTHSALVPEGDETAKVTLEDNTEEFAQVIWKVITATKDTTAATDGYKLEFKDPSEG